MSVELPKCYKKLILRKQTTNFREAVEVVEVKLVPPADDEILVKNKYVGINASDVNATAGRYFPVKIGSDTGFEGLGEVVQVGKNVSSVQVGGTVAYMSPNSYGEYANISERAAFPVPDASPKFLTLLVSGLTAAIGLDKSGRITEGETVLITAAAGGCGHIAVQWAKGAGCHVIGTCSSEKKVKILKDLGCDRVINYKTEDLDEVLTKEYPKGVDVIWETIGGSVFDTCVNHLAVKGRLIIVGYISGYTSDSGCTDVNEQQLPRKLLTTSTCIQGFLVKHYIECYATYFTYLRDRTVNNELHLFVDDGQESRGKEFVGMEGIIDAVEHLHTGKSTGKVIARVG